MKKLVILAALATMSISGSAVAVQTNVPRAITIENVAAGTANFTALINANGLGDPVLAPQGTCLFNMAWTSKFSTPTNPIPPRNCTVRETKTVTTNFTCVNTDIDTTMFAGAGFNTNCSGFNQNGVPFGPQGGFFAMSASLVLGERVVIGGTRTIAGTFRDPMSFGFIQGIRII
jgi:hypothetical protein